MEGHRWKSSEEILSIYQSIWTLLLMIRFLIAIHLVEKRARLLLEDGLGFNIELAQVYATGY